MLNICFSLVLAALASGFHVVGKINSSSKRVFFQVEIESIDRRFVQYTDIDVDGTFAFKRVPEGLYKLNITGRHGRAEQRTIEVRPGFADAHGRIIVHIQLPDGGGAADRLKIGAAALDVSPKARDELRRAYAARGNITKAREHLEKAIEISPNFDPALNDLGTIYYRDGNFAKAK